MFLDVPCGWRPHESREVEVERERGGEERERERWRERKRGGEREGGSWRERERKIEVGRERLIKRELMIIADDEKGVDDDD